MWAERVRRWGWVHSLPPPGPALTLAVLSCSPSILCLSLIVEQVKVPDHYSAKLSWSNSAGKRQFDRFLPIKTRTSKATSSSLPLSDDYHFSTCHIFPFLATLPAGPGLPHASWSPRLSGGPIFGLSSLFGMEFQRLSYSLM